MRTMVVALALVAVGLAGCADAPTNDDPVNPGTTPAEEGLEKPEWEVGFWWTYETPQERGALVVAEDTGSSWVIETNNEDWGFWHAAVQETSYMGEQRKSDLAGSQGGSAVQFFDWPLTDGKSWTTTWDDEQLTITASRIADTTYRMEGRAGDALRVSYEYRAGTGWFQWMSFFNAAGEEVYRLNLLDSGAGFDGEMVRVEARIHEQFSGGSGAASTTFDPFNAGPDSDVYLDYEAECTGAVGEYAFALGPAQNIVEPTSSNDDGYNHVDQCPFEESFQGTIGWEPNEGNWGFVAEAPLEASYSFTLWVREFERFTL